jgi:hypothetical protein
MYKRSFYQDRLRTNIGKLRKEGILCRLTQLQAQALSVLAGVGAETPCTVVLAPLSYSTPKQTTVCQDRLWVDETNRKGEIGKRRRFLQGMTSVTCRPPPAQLGACSCLRARG